MVSLGSLGGLPFLIFNAEVVYCSINFLLELRSQLNTILIQKIEDQKYLLITTGIIFLNSIVLENVCMSYLETLLMTINIETDQIDRLAIQLEKDMLDLYGPMLSGKNLVEALGYGSSDALRQATCRKTVPVPIFPIEKRKGKFALTKDVAYWLAKQRIENAI